MKTSCRTHKHLQLVTAVAVLIPKLQEQKSMFDRARRIERKKGRTYTTDTIKHESISDRNNE
jgi:hypothetical protein